MNVRLDAAEECARDGTSAGVLGELLIRCNNVMYVRAAPGGEAEEAMDSKE
jgi:small nuclear ribonucleoprotein (snRNP)-like protein